MRTYQESRDEEANDDAQEERWQHDEHQVEPTVHLLLEVAKAEGGLGDVDLEPLHTHPQLVDQGGEEAGPSADRLLGRQRRDVDGLEDRGLVKGFGVISVICMSIL